jgi:rSAM/selenodomain-associated transferase 1
MAKAPRPGEVKTRLVPPLMPESAAELHKRCILDTLEKVSRLKGVHLALAYAPADAEAEFQKLFPGSFLRFPQEGSGLGQRMLNCFRAAFAEGFSCAALYGTDIPHAQGEELRRGLDLLETNAADLVLGPTQDGGYYFIGARTAEPELFQGIEWSTPSVYETTLTRAASLGLRTTEIAKERDLDTPEDLTTLRAHLTRSPDSLAPRTKRFILKELKDFQ